MRTKGSQHAGAVVITSGGELDQTLGAGQVVLAVAVARNSVASDQESPPLPYYSEDAVAHSGYNVFLDRHTGDRIIIWDEPNENGTKLRIPVELARHIQPGVETEIEYLPASRKLRFSFTLTNGKAARQPVDMLYFVGLQDPGRYQTSQPAHWLVTYPQRPVPVDRQNQFEPIHRALILFLTKLDPSGVVGVPPGKSRTGFQLLSFDRPGLIDIYAQGKAEILSLPSEPSEKIRSELLRITYFPYNYRHTLAVAPKYDEQMPRPLLADAYQKDLQTLRTFEGQPATSRFFQQAAQLLTKEKTTPGLVDFAVLSDLANTALERDLAHGLAVSLRPSEQ